MDPTFQRKSRLVKNIADNRHFEKRLLEVKFIAPLVFRSLLPYLFCSTPLTLFYFFFLSTWSPEHRQTQNFFDGLSSFGPEGKSLQKRSSLSSDLHMLKG